MNTWDNIRIQMNKVLRQRRSWLISDNIEHIASHHQMRNWLLEKDSGREMQKKPKKIDYFDVYDTLKFAGKF